MLKPTIDYCDNLADQYNLAFYTNENCDLPKNYIGYFHSDSVEDEIYIDVSDSNKRPFVVNNTLNSKITRFSTFEEAFNYYILKYA